MIIKGQIVQSSFLINLGVFVYFDGFLSLLVYQGFFQGGEELIIER